MTTTQTTRTGHPPRCQCSVCWAHHFADALVFFPYTEAERTLHTDYLTHYDYFAEFKLEHCTSNAVERASS